MATIHLSTYCAWALLKHTLHDASSSPPLGATYGLSHQTNSYYGYFRIFKGTVPTDFSFATDMVTYTRSADKLLEWNGGFSGPFTGITLTDYTIILNVNLTAATASASGTATWFWWCNKKGESQAIGQQILGSIGVTNSGADLEIANTSIVSGTTYRIQDFKWTVPTGFTY